MKIIEVLKTNLLSLDNISKRLPPVNKTTIYNYLSLVFLFAIINFHVRWFINIPSQVYLFFDVGYESFVHYLVITLFGIVAILSSIFWVYLVFKDSLLKGNDEDNIYDRIGRNVVNIVKSNRVTFVLSVVFFIFYGSSSKFYNNYKGLYLETIYREGSNIVGSKNVYEYLEYLNYSVPDEIYFEIDDMNNRLFSNNEFKELEKRVDEFDKYYDGNKEFTFAFESKQFVFKETGASQGFDTSNLHLSGGGIWQYFKSLFIAFLEFIYRAFSFFLIASLVIQILLFIASFFFIKPTENDKQAAVLVAILAVFVILFIGALLYSIGVSVVEWVKGVYNWIA